MVVETKSTYISKVNDDTVKVILKPYAVLGTEEYNSFYPIYVDLMGYEGDYKFLIIIQSGARVKKKHLDYFKKDYKTTYKIAEAYLIISPVARMFLKVLIKIVNKRYPVRLFDDEAEAIAWLESIK